MGVELVRGENQPLAGNRLRIHVSAAVPLVVGAVLDEGRGAAGGGASFLRPGAPARADGLRVPPAAARDHELTVDLAELPAAVGRLGVVLALPPGRGGRRVPDRFGVPAPPRVRVTGEDGSAEPLAFVLTGLDTETAVVAVELYRRHGGWRLRAVGQGYADGLPRLLADHGVPDPAAVAAAVDQAIAGPRCSAPAPPSPPAPALPPPGPAALTPPPAPSAPPPPLPPGPAVPDGSADHGAPGPPWAPAAPRLRYPPPRRHRRVTPPPPAFPPRQPRPSRPARWRGAFPFCLRRGGRWTRGVGGPGWLPYAGDAAGWSLEERLYNQVNGMFEDLARAMAGYRGAVEFADGRLERELDRLLGEPGSRLGAAVEAARDQASAARQALVDQARAALDRDLRQLTAESEVVEPALPSGCAGWESPVWQAYRPPEALPWAVRLGDLHLPEVPELRIPMLTRLPLECGLWVDSGHDADLADEAGPEAEQVRRRALETAVALVVRLLAVHPAGGLTVHLLDPAGTAAAAFGPAAEALRRAGVLAERPGGVAEVLEELALRSDLVRMASDGRGTQADPKLPGPLRGARLLVVNDFPYGFDDRSVALLGRIAEEGPDAGVLPLVVAARADAAGRGPVAADVLGRSLLRLTPFPGEHVADPWVGHTWTYEPLLPPEGSRVLERVLGEVAAVRQAHGR